MGPRFALIKRSIHILSAPDGSYSSAHSLVDPKFKIREKCSISEQIERTKRLGRSSSCFVGRLKANIHLSRALLRGRHHVSQFLLAYLPKIKWSVKQCAPATRPDPAAVLGDLHTRRMRNLYATRRPWQQRRITLIGVAGRL